MISSHRRACVRGGGSAVETECGIWRRNRLFFVVCAQHGGSAQPSPHGAGRWPVALTPKIRLSPTLHKGSFGVEAKKVCVCVCVCALTPAPDSTDRLQVLGSVQLK